MSFSFTYHPHEPAGSQYRTAGAERDVVASLMARGLSESDALRLVCESRTHVGRQIKAPRRLTPQTDSNAVAEFIADNYEAKLDAMVPFSDFYFAFSLTHPEWSRKRVSQSLPVAHPSVAGSGNRKFVLNLKARPRELLS